MTDEKRRRMMELYRAKALANRGRVEAMKDQKSGIADAFREEYIKLGEKIERMGD